MVRTAGGLAGSVRLGIALPVRPGDVTPEWLTLALAPELLGDAVVTEVRTSRVGGGKGHLGSNILAEMTYSRLVPGAPRSVVVKMPADSEESRETSRRGSLYEREYRFFTELAAETDARFPHCFAAAYDVDSDEFVLVLEDVRGRREHAQLDGCPADVAIEIAAEVARIHAPWWRSERLAELPWLTSAAAPARIENTTRFLREGWPLLADELAERTGLPAGEIGERILAELPAMITGLDDEPHTLLHGDLRLDNITFDAGETCSPVVLLDWQNVSRGAAAMDLGYFLAQNLAPDEFRRRWRDVLAAYHLELCALGVTGATLGHLVETVKQALPFTFAVAASVVVLGGERGRSLGVAMGERALTAAAETGLLDDLRILVP